MLKILTNKIKRHLLETFATKNKEAGIGVTGTLLLIGIPTILAYGAYEWVQGQDFFGSIVAAISSLLIAGSGAILELATKLLTYVLSPAFTNRPIVGFGPFDQSWASIRDLTNMLIVLGFVVVGIATTLRIRDYEAKKLLPWLIGVAILINFSGFFCGAFINGANITTTALLQQGASSGVFGSLQSAISSTMAPKIKETAQDGANKNNLLGTSVLLAVVELFAAWIYLLLAVLMAARYAILGALYITSPLAFFAIIFPATKPLWKKWSTYMLEWGFLGVTIGFFIVLGLNVIIAGSNSGGIDLSVLFVGLVFLYVGYKMARGGAAQGAGAVVGLAAAGASMAIGATAALATGGGSLAAGAAKIAGEKTGLGPKISNMYGRALESVGIRKPGETAGAKQGQLNEGKKNMSALIAQGGLSRVQAISEGRGLPGLKHTSKQRAEATAALLETNNFDVNNARQVAGLSYYQNEGGNLSEYVKKNPLLAKYDKNVMQKLTAPVAKGGEGYSPAHAEIVATRRAANRMSSADAGQLSASKLTSEVVSAFDVNKAKAMGKYGDFDAIEEIKKYKNNTSAEHVAAINHIMTTVPPAQQAAELARFSAFIAHIQSDPLFA